MTTDDPEEKTPRTGGRVVVDPEQESHIERQSRCFLPADHEFPVQSKPHDKGFARSDGLSDHIVSPESWVRRRYKSDEAAYGASDIHFDEETMRRELVGVLQHHNILVEETRFTDAFCKKLERTFNYGDDEPLRLDVDLPTDQLPRSIAATVLQAYSAVSIKPQSRLWYALNIFAIYFVLPHEPKCPRSFLSGMLWAEYLAKLRHEEDVVRGKKIKEDARAGGVARAAEFDPDADARLRKMDRLIAAGHTRSNAAHLAPGGYEANRKLLARRKIRKNEN